MDAADKHHARTETPGHYGKFALMTALSFVAMYVLMYAMVDSFSNVINNVNQVYMAALMTSSMGLIEVTVMWGMYRDRKRNVIILAAALLGLVAFYLLIRNQAAVSDRQFLKSMIPHHAAAILMVEKADLSDPEVKKLAGEIVSAQQKEIDFMKARLEQMQGK